MLLKVVIHRGEVTGNMGTHSPKVNSSTGVLVEQASMLPLNHLIFLTACIKNCVVPKHKFDLQFLHVPRVHAELLNLHP